MPTISKMWDPSTWRELGFGGNGPIYKYDLEHFKQMTVWYKNVLGGIDVDNSGKKMLMVDNWNEFGEGHYFLPTYGEPGYKGGRNGFGYLDVLRETFGVDEYSHTDNYPLEEGYGPYDKYYPKGWDDKQDPGFEFKPDNNFIPTFDSILGSNAFGGDVVFNKLPSISEIIDNIDTDNLVLDNKNSIRINIESEIIAKLKEKSKGLDILTSIGKVTIPTQIVSSLDANKSLDLIFTKMIDVTNPKAILKSNGYTIEKDNTVYNFQLMQSNESVKIGSPVAIKLFVSDAQKYKFVFIKADESIEILDTKATSDGEISFNVSENGYFAAVSK